VRRKPIPISSQFYTQVQKKAPKLYQEAGSVGTNTLTYDPVANTADIVITIKPSNTNIYNTAGVDSNLRLRFMENYSTGAGLSVDTTATKLDQPSYNSLLYASMPAAWTGKWLSASCQNPGSVSPAQGTDFDLRWEKWGANNQTWPYQYCNDRTPAAPTGQGPKGQQRWYQAVYNNGGFKLSLRTVSEAYKYIELYNTSILTQSEVYIPSDMENNGCSSSGIKNDKFTNNVHTLTQSYCGPAATTIAQYLTYTNGWTDGNQYTTTNTATCGGQNAEPSWWEGSWQTGVGDSPYYYYMVDTFVAASAILCSGAGCTACYGGTQCSGGSNGCNDCPLIGGTCKYAKY
jgi:hypothetical protein